MAELRNSSHLSKVLVILGLVLLGYLLWNFIPFTDSKLSQLSAKPRTVVARGDLASDEAATIEIFSQASPSVVFITTSQRVLNYWTRDIMNVPRGNGSGFIWDEHGHVVTNNHVIAGASSASVRLNDGRSYEAAVIGYSPDHDLAVLRIDVGFAPPPPVPIGTSADLKVGQKVFAIGNPFGLDYTLTSGLLSALNRSLSADGGVVIKDLIQTDAAINPGNSGGPLLDSSGRLIGINTAIYSPSGAYAGIGFAVPVDTVNHVVPQLISRGKYIRPSLGITVDEDINQNAASRLGFKGVLVLEVIPGSAAERAGLRASRMTSRGTFIPGDVILEIDGDKVESVADLSGILNNRAVGDLVALRILRNQEELELNLTLQAGS